MRGEGYPQCANYLWVYPVTRVSHPFTDSKDTLPAIFVGLQTNSGMTLLSSSSSDTFVDRYTVHTLFIIIIIIFLFFFSIRYVGYDYKNLDCNNHDNNNNDNTTCQICLSSDKRARRRYDRGKPCLQTSSASSVSFDLI